MLPTVFAASLFSLGPFFLPYVWLWLAFGATAAPAARGVAVRRKRRIVLRDPSAAAAPALRDALTP
jgi:hypothetical protein